LDRSWPISGCPIPVRDDVAHLPEFIELFCEFVELIGVGGMARTEHRLKDAEFNASIHARNQRERNGCFLS